MAVRVDIDSLAGHLSGALAVEENQVHTRGSAKEMVQQAGSNHQRHHQHQQHQQQKKKNQKLESVSSPTPEYEAFERFADFCSWNFDESTCSDYLERSHGARPIPIERACKLRKDEVTQTYLIESKPVIVTDSQDAWQATSRKWTPTFFSERYSQAEVIANDRAPARKRDLVLGRPQRSVKMPLSDYIAYLQHFAKEQKGYDATASNGNGKGNPPLYLNGWHAFRQFPELLDDINYPSSHYFLEDHTLMILNEVDKTINKNRRPHQKLKGRMSDGRTSSEAEVEVADSSPWAHDTDVLLNKIFIGPAGNITRLHFDAHQAHGWLSQVKGRKLFVLFPPKDTAALCPLKGEATTQSPIDPLSPSTDLHKKMFPKYGVATEMHFGILSQGETLLIPAGWWHFAVSLETSITVMRNFYNALTNVQGLVKLFANTYQKTVKKK